MIDDCEDVDEFKISQYVMCLKEHIEEAANKRALSAIEMCEVRDYLLFEATLKTGTRPGALEKATLQQH